MSHLGDEIAALVDGELSHDARDRALAHLTECAACRSAVDAQRRAKASLRDLAAGDVPPALEQRLRNLPASLSAPPASRPGRQRQRVRTQPGKPRPGNARRGSRARLVSGAVVLGVLVVAFVAGGGPPAERNVRPQVDRFGVEHAAVTPEVPLTDQGSPAVDVSFPLPPAR